MEFDFRIMSSLLLWRFLSASGLTGFVFCILRCPAKRRLWAMFRVLKLPAVPQSLSFPVAPGRDDRFCIQAFCEQI
jgi:hypothetical protein